ncbi:hypothetical protein LQF76_03335 [Gloeomargaritales cyanobacterium VI4D9]|nr:hypothetical protein LQF76_03335 [Gloeomargaritales cyanobacterium VI4D9]
MKVIYHDNERLVLETKSGNFYTALVTRLFQSSLIVIWLVFWFGTSTAHQKIVQCTKTAEKLANCQVTNTYFWGLLRYVETVDNVSQVVFETSTQSRRVSRDDDLWIQYSVYAAVMVSPDKKVTIIQKNSRGYVQQVKNEFETFLNSAQTKYHFNDGLWDTIASGLLLSLAIPGFLVWMVRQPYRGRLIFNKKKRELISSGETLLGNARLQTHPWNGISLVFADYSGSDDYGGFTYEIYLLSQISRNDINLKRMLYPLKYTGNSEEAQRFWESDPYVQILKQFVHSEVK